MSVFSKHHLVVMENGIYNKRVLAGEHNTSDSTMKLGVTLTMTETTTTVQQWTNLAQQLRVDSIRCTTEAGSGHPTSSMSAADLMAVLMSSYLHYDFDKPGNPNNDHLIFSKGHASPLLYSMYKAAGAITDAELMTLRKFGSRLEGHPTPAVPWLADRHAFSRPSPAAFG